MRAAHRFAALAVAAFAVGAHAQPIDDVSDGDRAAAVLLDLAAVGPAAPDGTPLFPRDLAVVDVDIDTRGQARVLVRGSFFTGDARVDGDLDDLRLDLAALGPAAPDGTPLFPRDLDVVDVDIDPRGQARVVVRGSFFTGDARVDGDLDDLRLETMLGAFGAAGVVGGVHVVDADTGALLGAHLHHDPKPTTKTRTPRAQGGRQKSARTPFGGALVGKRIAISAGHGWLDTNRVGNYGTQRARYTFSSSARGITEDFFTAEFVGTQLLPLLQGMGAEIVAIRAPDQSTTPSLLVDASGVHVVDGTFASASGGVGGTHLVASAAGEGLVRLPIGSAARASREVAIRFPIDAQTTSSAVVTVVHAAGERTFNVDPRGAADGWIALGAFVLDADSVVEIAATPSSGRLVVDAVEVGGGMHGPSNKPYWQMSAQTTVPERRAPAAAGFDAMSDVNIRPAYAELFDVDAYVAIHSNGSTGTATATRNGLSVYRYSCSSDNVPYANGTNSDSVTDCDDPPGSKDLIDDVHAAMLAELRTNWDPSFTNDGKVVANFGELRGLIDTPGILVETAYHDQISTPSGRRMSDNRALHDPRFREALATGLVRGLARFFNSTGDAPPARPTGVSVKNVDGDLVVGWNAVSGAAGYRVYRATIAADGVRAFDEGVIVNGGTSLSAVFGDVRSGQTLAFKVAALDDNGEGFASNVVAARVGTPVAVLVDAYDRVDAFVQSQDNTRSYAFEHAQALSAALSSTNNGGGFDGVSDEVVEAGLSLSAYPFVDVWTGKDSTEHTALSSSLQTRLRNYVTDGGRLFVSGEEIGYGLGQVSTNPADAAFLAEVLGATFVADDAETNDVTLFDGVARIDDGTGGVYAVQFPDVIAAASGAEVIGSYAGARGAMVHKGRVVFLATPFEALVPSSTRTRVMGEIVALLDVPVLPIPAEGEGEGEGEGEEGEGEGEEGEGEEGEGEEGEGEPGEGEGEEGEGEPGEGEGEEGEGEGEGRRIVIRNKAKEGCGCSGASPPETMLLVGGLLVLRRRRRQ